MAVSRAMLEPLGGDSNQCISQAATFKLPLNVSQIATHLPKGQHKTPRIFADKFQILLTTIEGPDGW
jgi:hypothetical protein